jgi:hypothetical protein
VDRVPGVKACDTCSNFLVQVSKQGRGHVGFRARSSFGHDQVLDVETCNTYPNFLAQVRQTRPRPDRVSDLIKFRTRSSFGQRSKRSSLDTIDLWTRSSFGHDRVLDMETCDTCSNFLVQVRQTRSRPDRVSDLIKFRTRSSFGPDQVSDTIEFRT